MLKAHVEVIGQVLNPIARVLRTHQFGKLPCENCFFRDIVRHNRICLPACPIPTLPLTLRDSLPSLWRENVTSCSPVIVAYRSSSRHLCCSRKYGTPQLF